MSLPADIPSRPTAALTPADREWIRRQARTARALAAEQRRWVQRLEGSALRRFSRQAQEIAKVR